MHRSRFLSHRGGWTRGLAGLLVGACLFTSACLRRPVGKEDPTTKISLETVIAQPAIDKIDLLVMVDNSASMADKQRILADAVPDLVKDLVAPKCVEPRTRVPTGATADPTMPAERMCPEGAEPAFPPITDMHIGLLSSSLGGMGGSECAEVSSRHNDDHGHLLARGENGENIAAAGDLHFLAWYPDVEKNRNKTRHPAPPVPAIADVGALESSFRELVRGVGQDGCGLEAQLESVYHFLVQPDPWVAITRSGGVATYGPEGEVDRELLRQRRAFLRPDSLVAVIVLTDEDDSSVDPLSFAGTGWRFMDNAPRERATAACADDPMSPSCTSCALAPAAEGCSTRLYTAAQDNLNVRFHHMKKRFGVDPQFPIQRYVDGFTKPRVPRRDKEHTPGGGYAPLAGCTNPLFAATLPDESDPELCVLPRGPRSSSLVYFALIGGIPNALVPGDKADAKIDWTKILGRNPASLDETGIDPHMLQSTIARPGLPLPSAPASDPIHGREWTTGGKDLQFACTFDLYERTVSGTATPIRRTCGEAGCDCDGQSDAPLCAAEDRSVQVKGKAYPTRRELLVSQGLGEQGIVASLCPEQLVREAADDYGYRPAVRAITKRLERSLVGSCLPRELTKDESSGKVSCLVLAMLQEGSDEDCGLLGLAPPRADVLEQSRRKIREEEGEAASQRPLCEVPQLVVPKGEVCRDASTEIGFCYVEAPAITQCAHALTFTKASEKLTGARYTMLCIEQSKSAP